MNNELTANGLADLTIEALERTAFVLAEPAEDGSEEDLPSANRFACIEYCGPSSGHVYLAASDGFVRELAASLLGVEPEEIDEAQCADAIRELANIVGGSVTLELGGADRQLLLGLPQNVEQTAIPSLADQVERCCLDSEGERLEVIWAPGEDRAAAVA